MTAYPPIDHADIRAGDEIEAFNNDMFHPFFVRSVVYQHRHTGDLWLGEWPLDMLERPLLVDRPAQLLRLKVGDRVSTMLKNYPTRIGTIIKIDNHRTHPYFIAFDDEPDDYKRKYGVVWNDENLETVSPERTEPDHD